MKIRFALIWLLLFSFAYKLEAQAPPPPSYDDLNKLTKNVTPISPEVTSLGRYAMQPPNYSNGTPQVSIPLFEIKENGISYPLELTYSYRGFRCKEEAEMTGLGWSLSEGVITRIVKDLPDENPSIYNKFEDLDYNNLIEELGKGIVSQNCPDGRTYSYTANRLYNKLIDGKPDIYIYNFNGHTGRFLWIKNKAYFYPHTDLKIEKTGDSFFIHTPDGMDYQFDGIDQFDNLMTDPDFPNSGLTNKYTASGSSSTIVTFMLKRYFTAWKLTKILNKTTKAEIRFEYGNNYAKIEDIGSMDISSFTFWGDPIKDAAIYYFRSYINTSLSETFNNSSYLKKIYTDHVVINLTTKSRLDYPESQALDMINIFSTSDLLNPVKTIKFTHGYFGNSTASTSWLKLKKINITGGGEFKEYSFDYKDESDSNPGGDKLGCSIDHWGFTNGTYNTSLVPKTQLVKTREAGGAFVGINLNDLPWANREPNFDYSSKYALTKIYYPTKGYTAYNYESAGGRGIRIEGQEDYDGEKLQHKFYKYYPDEPIPTPPYNEMEYSTIEYRSPCTAMGGGVFYPSHYLVITGYTNNYLNYYDENTNFYEQVTEYIGSHDGKGGRNEYKFVQDLPSFKTLLVEEASYKYNSILPEMKTVNSYSTHVIKGIQFWGDPYMTEKGEEQTCAGLNGQVFPTEDPKYFYSMSSLILPKGQLSINWLTLDNTAVYENRGGNTVTKISKTYFNPIDGTTGQPKNTFPIKTEDYLSGGKISSTEYYYPGDNDPDNSSQTLGIPQLWDPTNANYKFCTQPVIKSKSFMDSHLVLKDYKIYTYDSPNDLLLMTGYEKYPSGSTEKMSYTLSYDSHANLLSYKETNNLPISYVYGYNNALAIAKVVNADYATIEPILGGSLAVKNFSAKAMPSDLEVKTFLAPLYSAPRLKNAMVSTYTYKPLVGMTSATDENGISTSYETDAYGRLSKIRDDQLNILKTFDYSYKTSLYPAPTVYTSNINQLFTKQNCQAGKVGMQITYTATATSTVNQEDADYLAQQDINKNGQNFANSWGAEYCNYPSNLVGIRANNGYVTKGRITQINAVNTATSASYSFDMTVPDPYAALPDGNYEISVIVEDSGLDTYQSIVFINQQSASICKGNWQGPDTQEFWYSNITLNSALPYISFTLYPDYCK
jgi:hypothetical protein